MDTFDAIAQRRSIRKFKDEEIPRETMECILNAALLAPSAKNRQPWKFVVITQKDKPAMAEAMRAGFAREKAQTGLFRGVGPYLAGAEHTLSVMEQAPVTVFVFNTEPHSLWNDAGIDQKLMEVANVQSVGAAIENMLLAATEAGVGSLWICDVFFAYRELCEWLNEPHQLIAAVSFGYTDESPSARPRRSREDLIEWR